jgi:Uma2 family endonuclease
MVDSWREAIPLRRMSASHFSVHPLEGDLCIPAGVHDFEKFRRWSRSDRFPERGRIDYLQGEIDAHMSPEDLLTHGTAKTAIGAGLHSLVVSAGRALVLIDRARVVSASVALSVEPDVVVVLRESLAAGRVRMVPKSKRRPDRYVELEGAPDVVVEVVSDSSVTKDTQRLPQLYAQAGIPEFWLADVRRAALAFEIWALGKDGYVRVPADSPGPDAWTTSPVLGDRFRLRRHEVVEPRFIYYELEFTSAAD